jgi:hypothetical protein
MTEPFVLRYLMKLCPACKGSGQNLLWSSVDGAYAPEDCLVCREIRQTLAVLEDMQLIRPD